MGKRGHGAVERRVRGVDDLPSAGRQGRVGHRHQACGVRPRAARIVDRDVDRIRAKIGVDVRTGHLVLLRRGVERHRADRGLAVAPGDRGPVLSRAGQGDRVAESGHRARKSRAFRCRQAAGAHCGQGQVGDRGGPGADGHQAGRIGNKDLDAVVAGVGVGVASTDLELPCCAVVAHRAGGFAAVAPVDFRAIVPGRIQTAIIGKRGHDAADRGLAFGPREVHTGRRPGERGDDVECLPGEVAVARPRAAQRIAAGIDDRVVVDEVQSQRAGAGHAAHIDNVACPPAGHRINRSRHSGARQHEIGRGHAVDGLIERDVPLQAVAVGGRGTDASDRRDHRRGGVDQEDLVSRKGTLRSGGRQDRDDRVSGIVVDRPAVQNQGVGARIIQGQALVSGLHGVAEGQGRGSAPADVLRVDRRCARGKLQ